MIAITKLLIIGTLIIVVLIPESRSEPFPNPLQYSSNSHPYCISQFAQANRACASILHAPIGVQSVHHPHSSTLDETNLVVPELAPSPLPAFDTLSHGHKNKNKRPRAHGDEHSRGKGHEHEHGRGKGHGHEHGRGKGRHGHEHDQGRREGHEHSRGHGHRNEEGHRHGHRHRRRHGQEEEEEAEECCRMLKAIDEECVCEMLKLKLPISLSIPEHGYKLDVDDECEVEFECPSLMQN